MIAAGTPLVVVTGGTHGLGLHLAKSFAAQGSNVAICARNQENLESAIVEIESQGRAGFKSLAVRADVSSQESVENFFDQVSSKFGRVDATISNAGVHGPIGPLVENNSRDWTDAVAINLSGSMNVIAASARHMIPQGGGRIVQISGGGATKPRPNFSAYSASKAAVVRLVETVALELLPHGIAVNAVAPGPLNTRLLQDVLDAGESHVGREVYENAVHQFQSGGAGFERAAELINFLVFEAPINLSGRLISALWDDWRGLGEHPHRLGEEVWTLRRVEKKTPNS